MKKFLAIFISIISLVMVSCGSPIEINEPEVMQEIQLTINNGYVTNDSLKQVKISFFYIGEVYICTYIDCHYDSIISINNTNYIAITDDNLFDITFIQDLDTIESKYYDVKFNLVDVIDDIHYYDFEVTDKQNNIKYTCDNFCIQKLEKIILNEQY